MSSKTEIWPELPYASLEGYLRHAAALDADRRQDTARADPVAQPLLACRSLCNAARPDHVGNSLWRSQLPARLRLSRPRAADFDQRWRQTGGRALPAERGRFLREPHALACRSLASMSASTSFPTRFRTRSGSARIRFTPPTTVISPSASGASCFSRAGARAVPHIVHRQMQSGAFLLGKFRSRGDALLGASRAEILRRWQRAEHARSGGARRLFARGQQRRVLAGRAGDRLPRLTIPMPRHRRPASMPRRSARRKPSGTQALNQFLLPYDAVRTAADPERTLMEFLFSTYEAAASLGKWDRAALECPLGVPDIPRKVEWG